MQTVCVNADGILGWCLGIYSCYLILLFKTERTRGCFLSSVSLNAWEREKPLLSCSENKILVKPSGNGKPRL